MLPPILTKKQKTDFWTGAPAFQKALSDVLQFGVPKQQQQGGLPADSPARWFRWVSNTSYACGKTHHITQPADEDAADGFVDDWVRAPASGDNCYWSVWGNGQPAADLAQAEWREELTAVLTHWVVEKGLDGIMMDAPPYLLVNATGPNDSLHDSDIAAIVRSTIVEPMHALGAAVFERNFGKIMIFRNFDDVDDR